MNSPQLFRDLILWIGDGTGLPDTMLHSHAGLAILLLVRVVTGRSLATFIPSAAVVMAEAGNQLMNDLGHDLRRADTLADIASTPVWPFVISLGVRLDRCGCAIITGG